MIRVLFHIILQFVIIDWHRREWAEKLKANPPATVSMSRDEAKRLIQDKLKAEALSYWLSTGGHPPTCYESHELFIFEGVLYCPICDYEQESFPTAIWECFFNAKGT